GERREGRTEAEEAAEDRPLGREPHGDPRDPHVLGREERPEALRLGLEERLAPEDGKALERLREAREEDEDAREEARDDEPDARRETEARHGTPSGPFPKAARIRRRWRRNIVPSSL